MFFLLSHHSINLCGVQLYFAAWFPTTQALNFKTFVFSSVPNVNKPSEAQNKMDNMLKNT